jgi:release factor glutamine methyltransferase
MAIGFGAHSEARLASTAARLAAAGCVFAGEEARLIIQGAGGPGHLERLIRGRESGVPLEHLLGWADFAGVRLRVEPGVFVPRRRSELLVEESAARLSSGSVVVDLCCGSGAIGLAIAHRVSGVELHATDVDALAVECARINLLAAGGHVHPGDLYAALPDHLRGQVNMVVASAPYVPSAELAYLPREAREHEPRRALDGGADGLDVCRRLIAGARPWLSPAGWVLVEVAKSQAAAAAGLMREWGFRSAVVRREDIGATVVAGTQTRRRPTPEHRRTP